MNVKESSHLPERNPVTHQKHRHEVLWQITIPLILGILVVLGLAALPFFGSAPTVSKWGDIALIWIILPSLGGALVVLALVAGLAYAVIWVVRILPRYTLRLQNLFVAIQLKVHQITDKIAGFFIRIDAFLARFESLRRSISGLGGGKPYTPPPGTWRSQLPRKPAPRP